MLEWHFQSKFDSLAHFGVELCHVKSVELSVHLLCVYSKNIFQIVGTGMHVSSYLDVHCIYGVR